MDQRELLIRTVLGEAGDQPPAGMAAVAQNILNRVGNPQYGRSVHEVVFQRNAYEAWSKQYAKNYPMRFAPGTDDWKKAEAAVDSVLSGRAPDISGGALNFVAPDLQRQLGRRMPSWAQGENIKIGGHTFYNLPKKDQTMAGEIDPLGSWGKAAKPPPASAPAAEPADEEVDPLGAWQHPAAPPTPQPRAVPSAAVERPLASRSGMAWAGKGSKDPIELERMDPSQRIERGFEDVVPTQAHPSEADPGQLKFNRMMDFMQKNPTDPYSAKMGLVLGGLGGGPALGPALPSLALDAAAGARTIAGGAVRAVAPVAKKFVGEAVGMAGKATGLEVLDQLTGGHVTNWLQSAISEKMGGH